MAHAAAILPMRASSNMRPRVMPTVATPATSAVEAAATSQMNSRLYGTNDPMAMPQPYKAM